MSEPTPPAFRLTVVCTGALYAAMVPWWIARTRLAMPELALRVVVSRSAARFVSIDALSVLTGNAAVLDDWPERVTSALHVELVEWSDAFALYPASAHSVARLANGIADTPSLLALQCTRAPIAVAPSLPEGALESPAMRRNLAYLAAAENILVIKPVAGRSWTTGRDTAVLPPPLPAVVAALHARLAAEADSPQQSGDSDR
jgi:phosphopantothenoylcysteine decarboxylase/phosphopantothenate--cysteine ligase